MLQFEWISDTALTEVVLLSLAFVFSAVIGLERYRKIKSAGLRTHTLVGLGTATFTLVSAYGFVGVLGPEAIVDPSRIAAQIVSGIGFLGAGVIFVRRTMVAGLTTAASIWVTASVGMACGAGTPLLAALTTVLYLVATTLLPKVTRLVGQRPNDHTVQVRYREGRGALRACLSLAAEHGFEAVLADTRTWETRRGSTQVEATVQLKGQGREPSPALLESLSAVPGVRGVALDRPDNE